MIFGVGLLGMARKTWSVTGDHEGVIQRMKYGSGTTRRDERKTAIVKNSSQSWCINSILLVLLSKTVYLVKTDLLVNKQLAAYLPPSYLTPIRACLLGVSDMPAFFKLSIGLQVPKTTAGSDIPFSSSFLLSPYPGLFVLLPSCFRFGGGERDAGKTDTVKHWQSQLQRPWHRP